MTFWIGRKAAIAAAELLAAQRVVGGSEHCEGAELPEAERITTCWAIPLPTADGRWAIPALAGLAPADVDTVAAVDWATAD